MPAELTPMMRQYMEVKEKYKDCILFYRLGDFYEMFFEDALLASRELEIVLTGRDCGLEERAPMCGVPYHAVEIYASKLIEKGYKVAICEQTTDPALSKGLVERDIVRLVSAGTVIEASMLEDGSNNYISCIYVGENGTGMVFADISTGEVHAVEKANSKKTDEDIIAQFSQYTPVELLFNAEFLNRKQAYTFIRNRY